VHLTDDETVDLLFAGCWRLLGIFFFAYVLLLQTELINYGQYLSHTEIDMLIEFLKTEHNEKTKKTVLLGSVKVERSV
jgi:hypothetical protein